MRGCFYLSILIGALSGFFAEPVQAVGPELFDVGAARAEITPRFPVRLSGFGFRRQESEGVYQRLWVKALAIGRDQPTVLLTVDNLGVPASLVDELARRLTNRGVTRERLVVSATHTHTAPMLSNACPTLFGVAIPAEQQENIDRYTRDFVDKLEKAALDALADRQPSRLFWGVGKVGFATNRRTPGGPVDQDLPVLVVRSGHGKLRALWVNYACHAVTLSHNKAGGDWPGYAQQALEDDHPGAIALVSIGCGADSNPSSGVTGDKVEIASRQGMEIAQEVKRLLAGYLAPLQGPLRASRRSISLPLEHLPSRDEWEKRANRTDAIGYHARVQLARLNRGEKLKTHIDYPITTWTFGGGLGMAFLPGEVVVDYSTRLKKELDSSRLWISAYSNDAPCYIPSERILGEGGYEGGGAMVYYDVPAHLRSGLEDKIVTTVRDLLGKEFAPSFDTSKVNALPLSPHQSLSTIRTHPGHKVLLAAAEPLVSSPVAINFAPDGRVFVAEMVDYPAGRAGKFEPGGRISVLSDSDGDGILDRSTVFLDNIPFPTAVTIWRGGVLVCAAPDILYAEDTDGDGKADRVEKRFSGFGADNYQARVNSLEYGLDGWLHGSCGLFGGSILSHRTGKVIKLGDRDFRLNPDTGDIEAATGRTQQGRVRDDFDNWFGCDNSTLAWHYVLPDHYLRRNPHVGYPNTTRFLADYPDSHRLYPIRAVQMFKLSGPPNMVTAACGIGVYRDDLLGKDLTGNLFTCESVNLLVHRLTLQPNGSTFAARRAPGEASREFVASSDSWMRPVHARTGPDGALWIVDMHRFVIEHPRWIPPEDLAKVDSRAGAGLGRILRVCPVEGPTRPMPRLNRMSPAELASALDNKNGTVRDLAVQMLLWHRDSAPAIPVLRRLAMESEYPEVRVQAMHTLAHLKALGREDVERALSHPHPGVRRHAIKLMEGFLDQPGVGKALVKRVDDSDPQVRLQLAFTLGNWHDPEAGRALARMLAHPSADEYLLSAIWSGVGKHNLHLLVHSVLSEPTPLPDRLRPLLQTAVGLGETEILSKVLRILAEKYPDGSANGFRLLSAVLEVANTRGLRVGEFLTAEDQKILSRWRNQARKHVQQTDVPELDRLAAISVLGRVALGQQEDLDLLAELLGPRETPSVQGAAIQALGSLSASESADALLSRWKNLTPNTRNQVLDVLLGRRVWREKLLTALEKKQLASSQIDAARRQRLLSDSDAGIRERATRLLASSAGGDRRAVVVSHAPALRLPGDVGRGKAVFSRACASCHRLENVGHDVGPDLAALANKTPPYLLQEILDPNRNVDSRYLQYIAVMATGQSHSGLLAQETATSLTLRMQDGRTITLLRNNVE
ncbi:MAG: neutral/alkaline non-lysosomal ceramidase N-terminal domain-containing protein, partial [Gemmataceae bacterium]